MQRQIGADNRARIRGVHRAMRTTTLLIAFFSTAMARGEPAPASPSVDEVVSRARAVMERKPERAVCRIHVETQLLDKAGKLEHEDKRDGQATLHGNAQDVATEHGWRDGKPISADELAAERAKTEKQAKAHKSDDDFELSPLAPKNAAQQTFELVQKETLWGRPAFVVRVRARPADNPTLANGTLWIDAERFVELKGELAPAKLPPHADWVKIQEQYALGPDGVPLPTFLHIEGAGHLLFVKKQFRSTLRWSDCR
jgi:hypothetical protein